MKRFLDRLQIWLYLAGLPGLAQFVGSFGTPPLPTAGLPEDERPTLPEIIAVDADDPDVEVRSGPGWSLDEFEATPLEIVNFDPTFNDNAGLDVTQDIATVTSNRDVN